MLNLFGKKKIEDFSVKDAQKGLKAALLDRTQKMYDLREVLEKIEVTISKGTEGDEITNQMLANDYEVLVGKRDMAQAEFNKSNQAVLIWGGVESLAKEKDTNILGKLSKLNSEDIEKELEKLGERRLDTDKQFAGLAKAIKIGTGSVDTTADTSVEKLEFQKLVQKRKEQR
tara:strand:+ start:463 stop:978 length:516 start_codon:yes stop_codon:yes gene_type:complete